MQHTIAQPATITDLRRDPKGLLKRAKKEKIIPILVHSEFEVAIVEIDELNGMIEELKALRRELFAQETLEASHEMDRGECSGPFETVEEAMKHLNNLLDEED
jgi:long-subunit acyl-CoA synthetase (AMP-forming)